MFFLLLLDQQLALILLFSFFLVQPKQNLQIIHLTQLSLHLL